MSTRRSSRAPKPNSKLQDYVSGEEELARAANTPKKRKVPDGGLDSSPEESHTKRPRAGSVGQGDRMTGVVPTSLPSSSPHSAPFHYPQPPMGQMNQYSRMGVPQVPPHIQHPYQPQGTAPFHIMPSVPSAPPRMAPHPPGNPHYPQQAYYQPPIAPVSYPPPAPVVQHSVSAPAATVERREPAKEELPAPQQVPKTPPRSPQVKAASPKPREEVVQHVDAPAAEPEEKSPEDEEPSDGQNEEAPAVEPQAEEQGQPQAEAPQAEDQAESAKEPAQEAHHNEGGAVDDTWSAMIRLPRLPISLNSAAAPSSLLLKFRGEEADQLLKENRISFAEYLTLEAEKSISSKLQEDLPKLSKPKPSVVKRPLNDLHAQLALMMHSFGSIREVRVDVVQVVQEQLKTFLKSIIDAVVEFSNTNERVADNEEDPMETETQPNETEGDDGEPSNTRIPVSPQYLAEALFKTRKDLDSVAKIAYFYALKAFRGKISDKYAQGDLEANLGNNDDMVDDYSNPGATEEEIINSFIDPIASVTKALEIPFYKNPKFFKWHPKFLNGIDLTSRCKAIHDELKERDILREVLGKDLGSEYVSFSDSYKSGIHRALKSLREFIDTQCYPDSTPKLRFSATTLKIINFIWQFHLRRVLEIAISLRIMSETQNSEIYNDIYSIDISKEVTDFIDITKPEIEEAFKIAHDEAKESED